MKIVSNNAEAKLLDLAKILRGDITPNYALHFHTSQLQEQYRSDFQLKIAVNILNDIFREENGTILLCRDGDVFVVYHGDNREFLDKAIFQLRYLFVDDPVANHPNGTENEDFCTMYDLAFQWRPFYRLATDRLNDIAQTEAALDGSFVAQSDDQLTPMHLVDVERELRDMDTSPAMRKQAVCAVRDSIADARVVYHEVYTNIKHLQKMLGMEIPLTSNRGLFEYITEILDERTLAFLSQRPKVYLEDPISLNLNIETVLSKHFKDFCELVGSAVKTHLVIEIHIADVLSDMPSFRVARDIIQGNGHRLCLDGLSNGAFVQVDRTRLGFDLAKLFWNADMVGDLGSDKNKQLKEAIERCGSNRMILCRCDSEHAIAYGHALGISLFQGRYTDRVIDPKSTIVN